MSQSRVMGGQAMNCYGISLAGYQTQLINLENMNNVECHRFSRAWQLILCRTKTYIRVLGGGGQQSVISGDA